MIVCSNLDLSISSGQVSSNAEYDSSTLPLMRRGRTKANDNDKSNKSVRRDVA